MYSRNEIPSVAKIGNLLEAEGLVTKEGERFVQLGHNCFDIASLLAEHFGFMPLNLAQAVNLFFDKKQAERRRLQLPEQLSIRSPAYLVIRRPDNPADFHYTFEFYGREFNYGAISKDGFAIDCRIPLQPKQK